MYSVELIKVAFVMAQDVSEWLESKEQLFALYLAPLVHYHASSLQKSNVQQAWKLLLDMIWWSGRLVPLWGIRNTLVKVSAMNFDLQSSNPYLISTIFNRLLKGAMHNM